MMMCQSKKRKNDAVLHAKPVEKRQLRGVEASLILYFWLCCLEYYKEESSYEICEC